jgi:hypothetical protein
MFDTGGMGIGVNPQAANAFRASSFRDGAARDGLPVAEPFHTLVPGGALKRGTTLDIAGGVGVTSLGLALAATPAQAGSWVAIVGHRSLGLAAVEELGIPLERLVLVGVPRPQLWASAVAALIDAFDLVLVFSERRVNARDARRLTARARERSNVIMRLGATVWPEAADLRLQIDGCEWHGLGAGHGVLSSRRLTVTATGRRGASRPRRARLWLPDSEGRVRLDDESAVVTPLPGVSHARAFAGGAMP